MLILNSTSWDPNYRNPELRMPQDSETLISEVPGAGWAQIVAFAGYYELFVYKYSGTPGDYGWKVLTSSDPEGLKKKLLGCSRSSKPKRPDAFNGGAGTHNSQSEALRVVSTPIDLTPPSRPAILAAVFEVSATF